MVNILLAIVAILMFVFLGPYFSILALNTLFGLGIEVTVGTWFASLWIMLVIGAAKGK
jgi:hypothetical protein